MRDEIRFKEVELCVGSMGRMIKDLFTLGERLVVLLFSFVRVTSSTYGYLISLQIKSHESERLAV